MASVERKKGGKVDIHSVKKKKEKDLEVTKH
jgi:hypothetical protein